MPPRRTIASFFALWLFVSTAAEGFAGDAAAPTKETDGCIDITPYVVNPENLSILKGGGNVPNDVAVYFDLPATVLTRDGPTIFCLEDILIPDTVGGKDCAEWDACQMAVGKRVHPDDVEGSSLSDYECLCGGFRADPDDPFDNTFVSGCGLANTERWGVSCNDFPTAVRTYSDGNGTRVVSDKSSAYFSLCPPNDDLCGICSGGREAPRFLAGVQWASNVGDRCFDDPFESYENYDSGDGLSDGAVAGLIVAGIVVFLAVLRGHRMRQRKREEGEER